MYAYAAMMNIIRHMRTIQNGTRIRFFQITSCGVAMVLSRSRWFGRRCVCAWCVFGIKYGSQVLEYVEVKNEAALYER